MDKKGKGITISSKEIGKQKEKPSGKCEFAIFIDEKAKSLDMRRRDVAKWVGIDPERFRKIVNRNNQTKKRDCIIACGFALRLSSGETNDALLMYDLPQLDDRLEREDLICALLNEQKEKNRSLEEINAYLRALGFQELDVIDHRKRKKSVNTPLEQIRYANKGIHVECRLDSLAFGDQYNSLATEYSPERYSVIATMGLSDLLTGQTFELIAEPSGKLSRIDYPIKPNECYHDYKSIKETGNLLPFFESLQSVARQELAKTAKVLKNSRNYHERISATVIDNSLHIFTETFNYSIPELQEYFLLDYVDGEFHFTVSDKSRFMELYLSPKEYSKYYGLPSSKIKLSFCSEEELQAEVDTEKNHAELVCKLQRLHAFRKMREKIKEFAIRINKDIFIVNPHILDDNDIDLLKHYHVSESDLTELKNADLHNGFILGLETLDEIREFKKKHGSLEIKIEF